MYDVFRTIVVGQSILYLKFQENMELSILRVKDFFVQHLVTEVAADRINVVPANGGAIRRAKLPRPRPSEELISSITS
jgi:hypothetical protein